MRTSMILLLASASGAAGFWSSCEGHGERCGPFNWCCGGLSCHPTDFRCYNSPRQEGEPCFSLAYKCEDDLTCENKECINLAEILESGNRGQCSGSATDPGTITVMTYNVYLILLRARKDRERSAGEIKRWFIERQFEDVVAFQEVFSNYDIVRDGMAEAGYCHYVTSKRGQIGSGLAIYSKLPIVDYDFLDFYDFGDSFNPEAISDKGIMYANIDKNGTPVHIFNTHTMSNSLGEQHETRLEQYDIMRTFISEKNIPSKELVIMTGDFNEDKFRTSFYNAMLNRLDAGEIRVVSDNKITYDGPGNSLADSDSGQYILDYVFYDMTSLIPDTSSSGCEVLIPIDSGGNDLSDHQPVTCSVMFELAE